MQEQVTQLIRQHLEPYQEIIESLSSEIEELRSQLHMVNRIGVVSSIDESNRLIKVKHGDFETPYIKWFALAAGEVKHYRRPTIDEQALLINYAAGESGKQYIALVGIDSSQFPIPATNESQVITQYGEDIFSIVDMDNKSVTLKVPNQIRFETKLLHVTKDIESGQHIEAANNIRAGENISAGQDVSDQHNSMDDMRDRYHDHTHDGKVPPPKVRMK
ncbi:phage baseplate assembly protein V [Alteromonadaceae bacterium M269]|nr:phage baseplate assembly protein V [Alteromonadaceae bacterium M269]